MEVIIILLILISILKIHRPKLKGYIGELRVKRKLENIEGYKLLNDIMLATEKGTSQIDHILIGRKGIFVIETKNYDGWIFGDEKSLYWTQVIYKSKNKFYNPIKQNKGHIKAIEEYIPNLKKEAIHSLIVFGNGCHLKKLKTITPVIYLCNLKRYIKHIGSNMELNDEEIRNVYDILVSNNITDKNQRKEHVIRIREKKIFR